MKKQKLYDFIFPIWFILIMPPILFILLPCNLIIDSIILLAGFHLIKTNEKWNIYKSTILKVWIIGFLVDIFGGILLLISQFLPNTEFLYNNIIYPLAYNPFKSILGVLYILIVLLICGILIYFLNKKISFKTLEKKQKHILSLLLAIFTVPYFFLVPTSIIDKPKTTSETLEQYKNSVVEDNKAISHIINLLQSGKHYDLIRLQTDKKPYQMIIEYKKDDYINIYPTIEQDAAILFYLIKNLDAITFQIEKTEYQFTYNQINQIFDEKLKELSIKKIQDRYTKEDFKHSYYGNISGYDIFDTSDVCGVEKVELYRDKNYKYMIECNTIDNLILVKDKERWKIKNALEKKIVTIEELQNTILKITKEKFA